ncbi:MAG: cysteine--tRNA ligase, partial [Promethearchaeota archaeon]
KLGYTAELGVDEEIVNNLIEILTYTRNELRKRKIFDLSDDIRKKLKDLGIEIEDKKLKS